MAHKMKGVFDLKEKMTRVYFKSREYQDELSKKIGKYFDFDVSVTYCEGDGFLILDVDTTKVFTFEVLLTKKKGIKLTRDDCFHYSF